MNLTPSLTADYPRSQAFLVKLRSDCALDPQDLAGRVEHVDSGLRREFRGGVAMVDVLIALAADSARRGF